jgi:hypothetical protein
MMHDGVLVAVRKASQALIPFSDRSKPFVDTSALQGNIPFLPELLYAPHTFAVHTKSFGVFSFVKHWHFLSAPPTPECLHLISF